MKPIRCTEMIERVYWSCNRSAHKHHATEESAAACISRHPNPVRLQRKWTMNQILAVVALLDAGRTLQQVATEYKLSKSRITQLDAKGRRHLKRYGEVEVKKSMQAG